MAEFNTCAHLAEEENLNDMALDYYNLLHTKSSPFLECLEMQNSLQEHLAARLGRVKPPRQLETKGELIDFLLDQKLAIDDEFRELIEAVHGMSRPESERSAGWKKWKSKHEEIRAEGINEGLTPEDIHERTMEMIDIMHFIMNCLLALGINSVDLYSYYMLKNKENFERQKRGY